MQLRYPHDAHRRAGIPISGESWRDDTYSDQDLAGVVFHECEFANLRLDRMDFSKCIFSDCRFDDCVFSDCRLYQTRMASCTGSRITITGGVLEEVVISEVKLDRLTVHQPARQLVLAESSVTRLIFADGGVEQDQMTLSGCVFGQIEAFGARWRDGMAVDLDLRSCAFGAGEFERTSFIRAAAAGADLSRIEFRSCNLYQSDFSGARLRCAESSIFAECLLKEADLTGARLDGALFAKARAENARFDGASLGGAMFPEASLPGASFEGARAVTSVWSRADLTGANLARMDASRGVFIHARLAGADVSGASFVSAQLHGVEESLEGADVRGAQGTIDWRAEREREAMRGR